jgi:LmbE family N-acetylglucosaminyl deacetylase
MIASRILILAPHPDDEIVACGIAAMRAREDGAGVFVLYLTTGVPEVHAPRRYADRVRRRRDEALAVAALLEIKPVGFRDTPARRSRCDLPRALEDVAAAIARCDGNMLWVPAFEGAHQDHDATNALAAMLTSRLPVWEFAAYNLAGGKVRSNRFPTIRGGEVTIRANEAEAARKRAAIAVYASERGNLRQVAATQETARPLPRHDYGSAPHAGRLFRERFHWLPFRHPRIDFLPSEQLYRELGAFASAATIAAFEPAPRGEARQSDGKFAGALDEAERQRCVERDAGDGGQRDEARFLGAPAAGDQKGGAAGGEAEAFEQRRLLDPGRRTHQIERQP